jgi:hypothetical protein
MDEQTKKYLVIGLAVVCLSVAGTTCYRSFFGGGSGGGDGDTGYRQVALMCKTCGGFEVSADEFREMKNQQDPEAMMMPGQTVALECPKCGKKSCYIARKCQQCENIFVLGQARDKNYLDRCPKCRFSAIEDRQKNRAP